MIDVALGDEFVGQSGMRAWATECDDDSITFQVERRVKGDIDKINRVIPRNELSSFLKGYRKMVKK